MGFKKTVLRFFSLRYFDVINLTSSKKSISFETPPPNTIASGSIVVTITTKLLAK